MVLELFLDLNGYELSVSDEKMLDIILAVAAGAMSDEDFIYWTRKTSVKTSC